MSIKIGSQVKIVGNSSFVGRVGKVIDVDTISSIFPYKVAFPRYKDKEPCIFERNELKQVKK
jgi:hypothetical protein